MTASMKFSLGGICVAGLIASRSAMAQACLRYEPDTVRLSGSLTRLTFPGRPNYESVAAGDQPETGFYLRVPAPICTTASREYAAQAGIRLVQLVLDSLGYAALKSYLGRRVTLRGTLTGAITAHHHAPVLLILTKPARID